MTLVALYQYLDRFALFLLGSTSLWFAVFWVITWLLHYEPVQFTRLPGSSRDRMIFIMLSAVYGVVAMVTAVTMESAEHSVTEMAITGCLEALLVFVCLVSMWISIIELRRAVRLRRQQPRQRAEE